MNKAIALYEGSYQFNVVPTNGLDNKAQVESLLSLAESHRHSEEGYWATVCHVEGEPGSKNYKLEEFERYIFDAETGVAKVREVTSNRVIYYTFDCVEEKSFSEDSDLQKSVKRLIKDNSNFNWLKEDLPTKYNLKDVKDLLEKYGYSIIFDEYFGDLESKNI